MVLNNIGVASIKMGKYDDAMSTFEHCVDERTDFKTALNYGSEEGDITETLANIFIQQPRAQLMKLNTRSLRRLRRSVLLLLQKTIKQSVNASLAIQLETSNAGELLRHGDLEGAIEVLKIAGVAANNLYVITLRCEMTCKTVYALILQYTSRIASTLFVL
ncbi:hypothetical protein RB195_007251 [Necator americanus]|uniref:Tetratricopeptide repeat protein n=1 Tax=Necator americanus TaxID=51031 RepID=A0ABR1BWF9_NECAM